MTSQEKDIHDSPTEWVAQHVRRYVETDGQEGHVVMGLHNLLLTTLGRRSGKLRRTALVYALDGDRYVLIASNGGAPADPYWYRNLVAQPSVEVQVGPEHIPVLARTVAADEYPRLWQLILDIMPWCADLPQVAGRHIPLVTLTPTHEESALNGVESGGK